MRDIRLVTSPLFPAGQFVHGWPERVGGVSEGEHRASLNLGTVRGDDPEAVAENRRRVAAAAGFDAGELVVTRHVHGTAVWTVGDELPDPAEFDGLVCTRPGPVLGAFAADCLPLLFADPVAKMCGAAHAGWRGTAAKVAVNVVRRMQSLGSSPGDILAAIGPSIGPCCFEVGDEVVVEFERAFGQVPGLVIDPSGRVETTIDGPKKSHVDLRVATRTQLEAVGVRAAHIDDQAPCTMCHPRRFFSYRRDGSGAGTHMGFIGLRG
jgi:hypothetical protein